MSAVTKGSCGKEKAIQRKINQRHFERAAYRVLIFCMSCENPNPARIIPALLMKISKLA